MEKMLMLLFMYMLFYDVKVAYGEQSFDTRQYCTDLNPQHSMDVDQLMGIWIGHEVIPHLETYENEIVYDTCVVIHITEVTDMMTTTESYPRRQTTDRHHNQHNQHNDYYNPHHSHSMRFLRLIWDEKDQTLEYTLRFNDSRPGFWMSSGQQQGSLAQMPYIQFAGTVQVLKAINNQLVLTFCQSVPESQLFSIVLSRKAMSLSNEETQSIRSLLKRRHLQTASVRKVCQNSSSKLSKLSGLSFIILAILTSILSHRN